MPDSQTTNRDYTKPEDGASEDTWGVKLNNNFDAIDDDVYALLTDAGYGANEGSANALLVNPDPAFTAYVTGMVVRFKAVGANSGAVTVNVNSLGSKNVLANDGSNLTAGAIVANGIYEMTYDGTQFRMTTGTPLASAAEVLVGTETGKAVTPASLTGNMSLVSSGYYKLPGGLILQWGSGNATANDSTSINFPVAFTSACFFAGVEGGSVDTNAQDNGPYVVSTSTTALSVFNARDDAVTVNFFAVGK
jgi:hypothetical protein